MLGDFAKTEVGKRIGHRMEELGISVRQLARQTGVVCEFIYQVVGGSTGARNGPTVIPSENALRLRWAPALRLDPDMLVEVARADTLERQREKLGIADMKNPIPAELKPLVENWSKLDQEHRNDILTLARVWSMQ